MKEVKVLVPMYFSWDGVEQPIPEDPKKEAIRIISKDMDYSEIGEIVKEQLSEAIVEDFVSIKEEE